MRHRKKKFTLGREGGAREALMRSLAESLVVHGSIRTTRAKARALRTVVEPLVTKAKRNTLAARREIMKVLYTDVAMKRLFDQLGPTYKERAGGYTRIVKLGTRATDSAEIVRIEFVS
jgi:large subunit ribosomal protein L17